MNLSASLLACGHSGVIFLCSKQECSAKHLKSVVRFNFFWDAMSAEHLVELRDRGVGRC